MVQTAQLRALRAVLDAGSIAGAAADLSLTASAVSQQISTLEATLGIALFVRRAQGVEPTAAATALGFRAENVLTQLDILTREAVALKTGARGVVRVGSFPSASARLLPDTLARLARKKAGVDVLLDEDEPEELLRRLQAGALDVALVYAYDVLPASWPAGLTLVPLLHEALVLTSASKVPALAADLADASDVAWIASREDTAGWRCLSTLCQRVGFAPRVRYRSNDYDTIRGFVAAGLGAAVIPALAYMADPAARGTALKLDGARRTVFVARRLNLSAPTVDDFARAVRQAARGCTSALIKLA